MRAAPPVNSKNCSALRGALALRFGVPMDALRYLVREFGGGKKAPKDIVIEAAPPGIRVGLTVDAMGTILRAVLTVFIEELTISTTDGRSIPPLVLLGTPGKPE